MNVDAIKSMGRPNGLPFRIGKIGHVGMYVKDLERSTRFYTSILGFQVSDAIPPGANCPAAPCSLRCNTDHHAIALRLRRDRGSPGRHRFASPCDGSADAG